MQILLVWTNTHFHTEIKEMAPSSAHLNDYAKENQKLMEQYAPSNTQFIVEIILYQCFLYAMFSLVRLRRDHIRTMKEHLYKKS